MAIYIGIKPTSSYPVASDASITEHGKPSKALKKEKKDQAKRQRIQNVFDGARKAAMHEGSAKTTLDFLWTRERAQQYPKTSATTKIKQKLGFSPKTETRTSLINEATKQYVAGVLGLPADLKEQKKGWRRAASVEFLHTSVGRLLSLITGVGSLGIDSELARAVLHQTIGYGPQAPVTGFGRMVSEIWQIQLNDGGKPKLPPQVQNAPELKEVRKGMKAVKQALRDTNPELRAAIEAASAPGALPEALKNLENLRDKVSIEKSKIDELSKKYIWRFAAFKRQYMGKRWGGAVSAFAGSVAAPLSFTIPPAGIAAQATATFVLQPVAGYADFMKDKYYTLRTAAKKIELSDLLKKESRGKSLDEITEDDIDIRMASKLYEQKPQAILAVTREIYRHKLAELMAAQRKLRADIESENYAQCLPPMLFDQKAKKEKALQDVNDKIENLKIQIGHFERGEVDQIDPDQTIGKALHDSWYFFKKGVSARYNNKVGEFWAQTFQRLGNNFQMLSSIGAMALVTDILNNLYGHDMIKDGIASLEGHEAHDVNVNAEIAAPALIGAQAVAGINAGVTVIPARDYKDTVDRKVLAVPDWIKKELKPGGALQVYLEDAVKKGLITQKKKKSIEEAADQKEQSQAAGKPLHRKAEKILKEWEELKAKTEAIQENWVVTGIIGKDGKPMTIDLRDSAACYRENVPMTQRALRVLKAIPPGLFSGPALLVNSLKTRRARKVTRNLVAQSDELISQADKILKAKELTSKTTEIQDMDSVRRLKHDSDYQRKLEQLQAGYSSARNAAEMTGAEITNNGETSSFQKEMETLVSGEDLQRLFQEEEKYSPQEDTFATSEMTGKDLRKINKELKHRDSNYNYLSRIKVRTSDIKSKVSHAINGDAELVKMSNQNLDKLMKATKKEIERRQQLRDKIEPKLKPSEKLEDITPQGLRRKWKENHASKTDKKDKFEDVLSEEQFIAQYLSSASVSKKETLVESLPENPIMASEQVAEKKAIHEDNREELGSKAGSKSKTLGELFKEDPLLTSVPADSESSGVSRTKRSKGKKFMGFLPKVSFLTSKTQGKMERSEGLRQIRNLVQSTNSDPQEMTNQLALFADATRGINQWFDANNYEVASNTGDQNNCLLIALLQHATGLYEQNTENEKKLNELARSVRTELKKKHGIPENAMLFAYPGQNDSGLTALMGVISEKLKFSDKAQNPVVIMTPFKKDGIPNGTPYAGGGDDDPHRPMNDDEVTNLKQQLMIVYGRGGKRHFEAVRNRA